MTLTQYIVVFVVFSVSSFIASRATIWYLLTRWFSHLEQWKVTEVLVNCGALGLGLSSALSMMLFIDGYEFIAVTLSIVFGYLVWPFLLFLIATVGASLERAVNKLDANFRRILGKGKE